jgi:hypothetical protein
VVEESQLQGKFLHPSTLPLYLSSQRKTSLSHWMISDQSLFAMRYIRYLQR